MVRSPTNLRMLKGCAASTRVHPSQLDEVLWRRAQTPFWFTCCGGVWDCLCSRKPSSVHFPSHFRGMTFTEPGALCQEGVMTFFGTPAKPQARPCACSSLTHTFTHPPSHPATHPAAHPATQPPTHSFARSLAHTHSLIHSSQ